MPGRAPVFSPNLPLNGAPSICPESERSSTAPGAASASPCSETARSTSGGRSARPHPSALSNHPRLVGKSGASNGCWCMYWRVGGAYRETKDENRDSLRSVIREGPPPGLLAFAGEMEVGWCQVTPRNALPWLDKTWRLKRVDAMPVWAISCFYVRKGWRRKGVTRALIDGAIAMARNAGAPAIEAYPLDGAVSPSATSTGYASTFLRAGFREVARWSPEKPILRYEFRDEVLAPAMRGLG